MHDGYSRQKNGDAVGVSVFNVPKSLFLCDDYGLTGEEPSNGISPQAARTKPSTAQPSME